MDLEKFLLGAGAGLGVMFVFSKMTVGAGLGALGLVIPGLAALGGAGYLVGGGDGVLGAGASLAGWYLWSKHQNAVTIQASQAATASYIAAQANCTQFAGQPAPGPGQNTPWMNCLIQNGAQIQVSGGIVAPA
jgi:hypothetical protein